VGFFDWLFGKRRETGPALSPTAPARRPPKAVYGLDDGSPMVVVDTGKVRIVIDRAQFDAVYGDLWAAVANKAPPDDAAVPGLVEVVRTSGSKEERASQQSRLLRA
jgi:hypothetical protein